jgi:hypothetical protein
MSIIDWGALRPSIEERQHVENRLARAPGLTSKITVHRRGSSYEASTRLLVDDRATQLRLYGGALGEAIDRLVSLLEMVAREQRRPAALA